MIGRGDEPVVPTRFLARLRPHLAALVPALTTVGLFLLWVIHNGGYDAETWYWGALAMLALLAATTIALRGHLRLTRRRLVVVGLFALYVAWCYLSMAWAQSPGDALQGANQALLYLLAFTVMLALPWTTGAALVALLTFVIGLGATGIVLLFDLATAHDVAGLVIGGRLAAPTGYFNATAALFTIGALTAVVLAARRELPGLLRGLLLACSCSGLQLALIVQSRGWLFTLPLVGLAAIAVVGDRLRVMLHAVIPFAATLAVARRLLDVYHSAGVTGLGHVGSRAGRSALLVCAAVLVVGTLLAWADDLWPAAPLSLARRRMVGGVVTVAVAVAAAGAGTALTHGDPLGFISRQWNGFSHIQTASSSRSHFSDVGSGRYDFWRVALDAFVADPIGGVGEDNFADYYVTRRRTPEEPTWTHSLELRLLAQTGIVGFALFTAFLIAAVGLATRTRRRGDPLTRNLAGAALLPLVVWLMHGSLDWFWEIPALSGPALGFLAIAASLAPERAVQSAVAVAPAAATRRVWVSRPALTVAAVAALLAGVVVLGLPYLSVREVSLGSDAGSADPRAALRDLATAASLNPLSSAPGRLAGAIALRTGDDRTAEQRFRQSIDREPGGWFSWLGAGLAASARGHRQAAGRDFARAYAINARQPAVSAALRRVDSPTPLTSYQAFKLLVIVQ
jgi:hypothetical protein